MPPSAISRACSPLSSAWALAKVGLGIALLLAGPLPAATKPPRPDLPLTERLPLMVGATADSYPHGYLDEDDQLTGFTYDVLEAVAKVMELRLERTALPGRELHARFRAGEFDFLQSFTQSPDREQFAEFSVPFLAMQGAIFVRKSPDAIQRLEDFHGRRFAIIGAGSIGEQFLRDHALQVEPVLVSSSQEALALVDRGECAGAFLSRLTALSVIERRGLKNVRMFDRALEGYDIRYSYAVHRGDAALLARLNEGLALIHRNGDYDRIYNRWFGRFDSPLLTRETVVTYALIALSLALLAAVAAYWRERRLMRRIADQAQVLARQHALLQALHDHMPLGLLVLERAEPARWRLLTANHQAARLLGLATSPEPAGRWLDELAFGPGWAEIVAAQLPPPSGEVVAPTPSTELTPAGSGRKFLVTTVRLPAADGGPPRLCLLVEEITARCNIEAELAQSRKMRAVGELTGGIAHEFNNLLTPILLKADFLRYEFAGQPEVAQELTAIVQTTERAAELTRRLLTLSRKTEARIEPVRLGAAVDSTLALLRLTVDRRIVWRNSVPSDLPVVQINPTELNQILVNLILNARDTLLEKLAVTRPGDEWGPRIEIEGCALPADTLAGHPIAPPALGWLRLTVRDNGRGIPPDVRERMFEPFYTTKDVGKGTGLGLSTVWHLVNFAGGIVEVDTVPDEGTAFHVYLPVHLPGAAPAEPVRPPPPPKVAGPLPIVVAEDDDAVGEAIVTCLRGAGYAVHRERDGLAAWRHLSAQAGTYALVIFDLNMPSLDGIELLQRLRTRLRYTGPALAISGRIGSEEMQSLTAAQVSRVLSKPFRVAEFLEIVRECLQPASGAPAGTPAPPTTEA